MGRRSTEGEKKKSRNPNEMKTKLSKQRKTHHHHQKNCPGSSCCTLTAENEPTNGHVLNVLGPITRKEVWKIQGLALASYSLPEGRVSSLTSRVWQCKEGDGPGLSHPSRILSFYHEFCAPWNVKADLDCPEFIELSFTYNLETTRTFINFSKPVPFNSRKVLNSYWNTRQSL